MGSLTTCTKIKYKHLPLALKVTTPFEYISKIPSFWINIKLLLNKNLQNDQVQNTPARRNFI